MKCYNCNHTNSKEVLECLNCHFPTSDSAQLKIKAAEDLASAKKFAENIRIFNDTKPMEMIAEKPAETFDYSRKVIQLSTGQALRMV